MAAPRSINCPSIPGACLRYQTILNSELFEEPVQEQNLFQARQKHIEQVEEIEHNGRQCAGMEVRFITLCGRSVQHAADIVYRTVYQISMPSDVLGD